MNQISTLRPEPEAPPHNVEAEQQLLGAILLHNDVFHRVSDVVTEDLFFDPVHKRIWQHCASRIKADHLASPVTLKNALEGDEGLRELGGLAYLARLAGSAISPQGARSYALTILDAYQRRVMLTAIKDAEGKLRSGMDMSDVQGVIEAAGATLALAEVKKPSTSFLAATTSAISRTFAAYQGEGGGLKTGIRDLDDLTGGLFSPDLIIIGATPSMGKTALAVEIAKGVAQQGAGVMFFSLEMGDSDIAQRVLSAECGIPYRNLRTGRVSEDEGRRYMDAATKLQSLPIEISGAHIRDVGAIFATAKRVQKRWASQTNDKFSGLRLIVVDYLQLVRTPAKDRFQMVAEVSMGLKALAKQLEVPVVALAQLNAKSVTERDDHRPRLSDLRESGQIEQDADMILFCHRDHYWLERMGAPRGRDGKVDYEKLADHDANMRACANQMDVLLAKARFGGIGDVKLGVDMALNRVWSLSDAQNAMAF